MLLPSLPRTARRLAAPAVLTLCALAAAPAGAFPGDNGDIVFVRGAGILSTPATGGAAATLTQPTVDHSPAVSPDGAKVAYVRSKELRVMNIDGSGDRAVATGLGIADDPAWSADGKRIVFAGSDNGRFDLYAVAAAGGTSTNLTNTPGNDERHPAASPDGKGIAYERTGCEQPFASGTCVYVMDASGANPVNLTPERVVPACAESPGYSFTGSSGEPAWAPDGSRIAFSGPVVCTFSAIGKDIWTMRPDGTDKIDLTRDDATNDHKPSYAPDGTRIAFARDTIRDSGKIFTMKTDGTDVVAVTAGTGDHDPDWAVAAQARCAVPKLKGKTRAAAKKALEQAGCRLGRVTKKHRPGKKGRVIAQGRKAGAQLPAGAKVAVTIRA